ncbi:MAG: hypothetical protein ACRY3E_00085 [Candidatus Lariskella arthropodorum]
MYQLFDKFTVSLDIIKKALKEFDASDFNIKYSHHAVKKLGVCPDQNSVMDNLYKQGFSLIAHQTKGNLVEWNQFVLDAIEQYITVLSQRWAEFLPS